MQTVDYCFDHENERVTTTVPLFQEQENNGPHSAFYTALFLYPV